MARLGCKGHTLSKRGQVGGGSQRLERGAPAAAGVSAGESNTAPQVVASRRRKRVDRTHDLRDIRAFHKPDTAAETLIEDASTVAVEVGNRLPLHVSRPTEIAFVKAVTVNHEPTK